MSEAEIIVQCQRNNKDAQRALFELNFPKLMQMSMRYSKNKDQAKAMLNDGFGKILSNLSLFQKSEMPFETWMKEVFIENAVQFLKSQKHEYYVTTTVRVDDKKRMGDLFNQIENLDPNDIEEQELLKSIQALPPSFRSMFNMCMIDGLDFKKASEILEVSEDTAKNNLEKATYQLHQNIRNIQKGFA